MLAIVILLWQSASAAAPEFKTIARPAAGFTQIIFHGTAGPFQIQHRETLDPAAPWLDMPDALVTEPAPFAELGRSAAGDSMELSAFSILRRRADSLA